MDYKIFSTSQPKVPSTPRVFLYLVTVMLTKEINHFFSLGTITHTLKNFTLLSKNTQTSSKLVKLSFGRASQNGEIFTYLYKCSCLVSCFLFNDDVTPMISIINLNI